MLGFKIGLTKQDTGPLHCNNINNETITLFVGHRHLQGLLWLYIIFLNQIFQKNYKKCEREKERKTYWPTIWPVHKIKYILLIRIGTQDHISIEKYKVLLLFSD